MTIEEAVQKLSDHLGDPEVFHVYHNGRSISVRVNFVYRTKDVTDLGDTWEGFPLNLGRVSCW